MIATVTAVVVSLASYLVGYWVGHRHGRGVLFFGRTVRDDMARMEANFEAARGRLIPPQGGSSSAPASRK